MSTDARRAVVDSLGLLAASPGYRERADAGSALAVFADDATAGDLLLLPLLDRQDTYVSRRTAAALAARRDATGFSLLARAPVEADPNHLEWIATGVDGSWTTDLTDLAEARDVCREVAATLPGAADGVRVVEESLERACSSWRLPGAGTAQG